MLIRLLIVSAVPLMLFITACNNGNSAFSKSDSSQNKEVGSANAPMPQNETPTESSSATVGEINNYGTTDTSSMVVTYHGMYDTIYGFRVGDTLFTEGDIKVIYPKTGIRGIGTTRNLWEHKNGKIFVPYEISDTYADKQKIKDAFDIWNKHLAASGNTINFIERTFQPDYISFVPSQYTQSYIGKIGGKQTIELADWARSGNVAHEIGHALGLYHEHTRSDRDKYVLINLSCAGSINYRHAFKTDPYASDIDRYDYNSIMHYPATECLSFPANLPNDANPGQRIRISAGDSVAIKKIYKI